MNDNNLLNSAGCTEVFHLETAVKEHMLSIGFLRGSSVQIAIREVWPLDPVWIADHSER
jgi:hypothetical protein